MQLGLILILVLILSPVKGVTLSVHFEQAITKQWIPARKDRVIALRLCFNCLTPGHSSRQCHSKKTCHICHLHHHTSLCNQSSDSSGDNAQSTKINQSSNASHGSQQQQSQQQHPHPRTQVQNQQPPVVTQHKSNTNKQHAPSSYSTPTNTTSAHVTNINVSNFPHNVLPTATLTVSYCNARTEPSSTQAPKEAL